MSTHEGGNAVDIYQQNNHDMREEMHVGAMKERSAFLAQPQ